MTASAGTSMPSDPGLRERKKEQMRLLIGETARRLFVKRGFDAVTVADVAQEADVSEGTVFNYFPTKEDLFYSGSEAFEAHLISAVRDRLAGESVLSAFERVVLAGIPRLARNDVADLIATAARIVASSRALRGRERELIVQRTEELARLIAKETGRAADDVEATAVAAALIGVQRALVAHVHASIVAGRRGASLTADIRSHAKRAFARLEAGLRDYAVKSGRHGSARPKGLGR
jgi:AcrR family transcriptional regulator